MLYTSSLHHSKNNDSKCLQPQLPATLSVNLWVCGPAWPGARDAGVTESLIWRLSRPGGVLRSDTFAADVWSTADYKDTAFCRSALVIFQTGREGGEGLSGPEGQMCSGEIRSLLVDVLEG